MANNTQEYTLKIIADAKGLTGGLSDAERSVKKLESTVDQLTQANKEVTKAAEKLADAQREGSEDAIKAAQKELEQKKKVAERTEATLVRQTQQTEKLIAAEKKKQAEEQRELGLLEKLEKELKDLQIARQKATKVEDVQRYNKEIQALQESVNELGDTAEETASEGGLGDLNDQFGEITSLGPEATQGLSGFAGQLINIGKSAGPVGVGIAALLGALTAVIAASVEVTKQTADYAKEQQNLQRATGVSASLVATLSEGLKRNGGDAGDTADSLLQLGQVIQTAIADPTGDAAKQFADLGVSVTDASGKALGIEDVFRQIDKSAQGAGLSQEKLVTLAGVLGEDAAKKLLPLIGSFGALEEQVNKTGLVLGEDTTREASKLTAGLAEVQSILTGVALSVGSQFLPAFNDIISQVKIAFETLSSNEDLKLGFQTIITLIKDFIGSAGPQLVILIQGLVEFIGRIGIVAGVVVETFSSVKTAIFGVDEVTKKNVETNKLQAQTIGQVTQQAATQTAVIDGLKKKAEQLNAVQQASIAVQKGLIDLRIQAATIAKEKGLISEEELLKVTLEKQVENAKEQLKIAEDLRKAKEDIAQKEKATKGRISNETLIEINNAKQAELEATRALSQAQFDLQTKPVQAAIEQNLEDLETAKEKRKLIELELFQFIDEQEKKNLKSHEDAVREKTEITKNGINEDIDALNKILENANLSKDQREKIEKDREKLTRELEKVEIESSAKIKDAKIKDAQDAFKAQQDLFTAEQNLAQAAFDRRRSEIANIKDLDLQRIQEKRLELDIADQIARDTLKRIDLETKQLELLKQQGASKEELAVQESKITLAIVDSNNARDEAIRKQKALRDEQLATFNAAAQAQQAYADQLAGTTEGFIKRNQELKNIIAQVAEQFNFAFDPKLAENSNVETALEQLEKYKEILAATEQDLLTGSGVANSILVFQRELALSSIEKLSNDISVASQRIALETAAKENEIRQQKARELAEELNKIAEEAAEERLEAEKERNKELKEIEKDRLEEIEDFNKREKENFEAFQDEKLEIVKDFDEREREIKDKALEDEKKRQKELIEAKEDAESNSLDKLNKLQRDAITERAKIEAQLKDNTLDPEKRKELEEKLKEITEKSNKEVSREKEKQAEIEKAIEESKSEEELKARLDAINKKFDLLEDEQKQREEIIKSGNAEELALFDKLIAEQKKRDEERLKKELERIEAQRLAKIEQAEEERKERQAELDARLQDLEDNYQKEKSEEEKRHQERLAELDERQKEIRRKYKETLEDITESQNKATASLAENAGLAGDAFQSFFSTGVKEGEKFAELLDKINSKLGGIIDKTGDGSTDNFTSSSSSSSTSSSASSSSGNVLGSPTQGNNNGTAGSLGNFIQQAPNQNNNQGNNQQNNNNSNQSTTSTNSTSPSSNQNATSPSSNAPISASANQTNQNSQVGPTGNGQIDDTVPKLADSSAYKARMKKLQKNLFDSAGIDPNKAYPPPHPFLSFDSKNKAAIEGLQRATQLRFSISKQYGLDSGLQESDAHSVGVIAGLKVPLVTSKQRPKDKFYTFKESFPAFDAGLDEVVKFVEDLKTKQSSKFDDDLGTTVTPTIGGNPSPNPSSNPNQPGGSRDNNPNPTLPSGNNPTAKPSNPSGLSDKEKAFFAGRDLDATQGSFEGEGAEKKGFVRFGPNFSGANAPTAEEALLGKGSNDVIASQNNVNQANATVNQGLVLQPGSIQLNVQASSDQIVNAVKGLLLDVINNGQLTNAMKPQLDKQFQSNLLSRNPQNAIKLS